MIYQIRIIISIISFKKNFSFNICNVFLPFLTRFDKRSTAALCTLCICVPFWSKPDPRSIYFQQSCWYLRKSSCWSCPGFRCSPVHRYFFVCDNLVRKAFAILFWNIESLVRFTPNDNCVKNCCKSALIAQLFLKTVIIFSVLLSQYLIHVIYKLAKNAILTIIKYLNYQNK